MSTVRFSKVLEACGKPDIHLLLIDPAKDKTLQAAIKSDRVMTIHQESGSTDYGIVGFEQGRSRQFLVFPKSLKAFDGHRIVGIKYDLLEDAPVREKETAKKEEVPEPAPSRKTGEPSKRADRHVPTVVPKAAAAKQKEVAPAEKEADDQESTKAASEDKVVKFEKPEPVKPPAVDRDDIKELKRRVREAMDALEEGKQVVAFNLLKSILETDR